VSAVEVAVEKVKHLPEDKARKLLDLIAQLEAPPANSQAASSASALGFARRYRKDARTTAAWMKDLREREP
jgi:hypothetical protein